MGNIRAVKASDLPVNTWLTLYLEEPLEDPNFQDGRVIESTLEKVVVLFGPYIGRIEYKPNEEIPVTWIQEPKVDKQETQARV